MKRHRVDDASLIYVDVFIKTSGPSEKEKAAQIDGKLYFHNLYGKNEFSSFDITVIKL